MLGGLIREFGIAMPAGGGAAPPTDLRPLRQTIHNMPVHFSAIDLRLEATITPHATEDEPGTNVPNILDRITLRDILNNVMVNLRGHHCHTWMRQVRGWRYPDIGTIAAAGQQEVHKLLMEIPFRGGHGGVVGYKEFFDCVQPIDRIREQSLEVVFNAGALANATLDAATLYVQFRSFPYVSVIQGADIRYNYILHPDAQRIELPITGLAVLDAGICNTDLSHGDYDDIYSEQFSYMANVGREQLIGAWNGMVADAPAQFESVLTPAFIPLIFQDRRGSVQGSIGYPGQKAFFDLTQTHAASQDLVYLQVHNTKRLADNLMSKAGTLYEEHNYRKPQFAKKNESGVAMGDQKKANRLGAMLSQKLA